MPSAHSFLYHYIMVNKDVEEIKKIIRENKIFLLCLVALTVAVYFNSLFGKFVSADDLPTLANPAVTNLPSTLKSFDLNRIVFSALYTLFGPNPFWFHLRSLVLHLLTVGLVFILGQLLFGKETAILASLLFAVHPVGSETVAWISAGAYLFFAVFDLVILIFYYLYRRLGQKQFLYVSLGVYSLALLLLHSPWLLTLPPVVWALDYFLLPKQSKAVLWFWVPALVFTICLLPNMLGGRLQGLATLDSLATKEVSPLYLRVPYSIYSLVRLLVFPVALSLFNEANPIPTPYFIYMVFISLLYLGLILIFWKRSRTTAGSMLIILFSVLPVFSPLLVAFNMAERYLYFGAAFLAFLIVWFLRRLEVKFRLKDLPAVVCMILILVCGFKTFSQNRVWHDSLSLWIHVVKVSPLSPRVYNNLGDAYGNAGEHDLAIASFQKAIELQPNYAEALHNLGNEYLLLGRWDEAETYFKKALEVRPSLTPASEKLKIIEQLRRKS